MAPNLSAPDPLFDPDEDGFSGMPELFSAAQWRRLVGQFRLSRRQAEVARLICRGLRNVEIADRLNRSVDVVRLHVKQLLKKLDARDRTAAVLRLIHADRKEDDGPLPSRRRE